MLTFTPSPGSTKDMTYDENGNLLTVANSCGTTTYTWDARNRLVAINGYKPDCSTLTATFKYDALNRRIEKTINGTTTKYLYDGLDIIQEIQGSNKTNYIRALNIDEPLTRIKPDGTVRHYVRDALGSIIALTDDTGVLKTTYTYDPFGNVTISGEASDNPFQYTGRENDGTGLYYYRARYYSPELQRFISEDPIGFGGGINFYAYVANNPVNYIDPLGLDLDDWTGFPSRREHTNRNVHNKCPKKEPKKNDQCADNKWRKDWWSNKYRSPDGSECEYDKNGDLIPDQDGIYTYNYGPDPFSFSHVWKDFLPHFWYGNIYTPGLTKQY